MVYIRYTVHTNHGRYYELARSYRNKEKRPACPYRFEVTGHKNITSVTTDYIDFDEKNKIYRRGDHVWLEPLINKLEEVSR